ncbi:MULTISPECIES: hypothetical protein [Pseudoalteromonas]|uniref:Uncharacterized protein n=1 Tax=Pseudoalteromonas maricaloris TaxID=184924 RepID=A0A8I2H800_9GAMM|nr:MULTISPECIES: hypothetical protein [Pseudoalteromonas]NLR23747.1 hypothetical protein [Pseudoalteromonas maricaloris]RZG12477.1 hypothetical protein EXT47_19360 [Pseudoalteromonas sp. CO342X]WOX31226.1 hypothetical protein R5H13_20000 [Pseudoalteromonas maricaloris]
MSIIRGYPDVSWTFYWKEYALLTLSIGISIATYFIFGLGPRFSQFGSLSLFFCAVSEFLILAKANQKHLNNAARAVEEGVICIFSKQDKYISIAALIIGLISTIIWGFGAPIST